MQKGRTGNPRGRPPTNRTFAAFFEALQAEKIEAILDSRKRKYTKKEILCRKIMDMAFKGDIKAIEFIADRTEGKVTQKLHIENRQIIVDIEGDDEPAPDQAQ